MAADRIRTVCGFLLLAAALATGDYAIAQTTYFLTFTGTPASLTCTTTSVTSTPGLVVNWNLTASTQVLTTTTAGGTLVKQKLDALPAASGTLGLDGTTNFPSPVAMPYTVVYALTPELPGAGTTPFSVDCVGGT